ncbi:MAG TPA: hypothetical protein VK190_03595 [Pseudoneobacillus sp.]|nr:hypothetical protein [Pseudoneobacillus sp.]
MNAYQKAVDSLIDDYLWDITTKVDHGYLIFKFNTAESVAMIKHIVSIYGYETVRLALKMYEANGFSKRDAFEQLILKYEGCTIEEYSHKIKYGKK